MARKKRQRRSGLPWKKSKDIYRQWQVFTAYQFRGASNVLNGYTGHYYCGRLKLRDHGSKEQPTFRVRVTLIFSVRY